MKTAEEWKIERWEGEDFIITGFGNVIPGTYTKREADLIMRFLVHVTPLVQLDAMKEGMRRAADIVSERGKLLEKNNAKDLIREHYHETEIAKAANALTLEDLK